MTRKQKNQIKKVHTICVSLLPVEGSQFVVPELKYAASLLHMHWLAGVHLNCVEHALSCKKSKYYLPVILVIWMENTMK